MVGVQSALRLTMTVSSDPNIRTLGSSWVASESDRPRGSDRLAFEIVRSYARQLLSRLLGRLAYDRTIARGGFWRQVVPKHSFELAHVVTSVSGSTARVNDCGGDAIWPQQVRNLPLVDWMAFVIGPFAVTVGGEKLLDLLRCHQSPVLAEEIAEGCEQTFALARLIALTR